MGNNSKMIPSKHQIDFLANTHPGQKITGAGNRTGDAICKIIDVVIDGIFKKR